MSTCAGWPNGKKTCVYLHPNLSSTKVHASPRKSLQVHASGWSNETQVKNLRRLASPFCQGFMTLKINTWYFWCSSSDIFCVWSSTIVAGTSAYCYSVRSWQEDSRKSCTKALRFSLTCLWASVVASFLKGRTSSPPKPGIHMFQHLSVEPKSIHFISIKNFIFLIALTLIVLNFPFLH